MSTSPGGRLNREPLKRWPPIRMEVLLENEFKADHPSFAPFPTITNVVNAALCPVAAVHDLLYGIDNARIAPGGWGAGELFHQFTEHLKISLSNGSCIAGGEKRLYYDFAERRFDAAREEAWIYVNRWLNRKRPELRTINRNLGSYFEVYLSNDKVSIDREHCSYPLRGEIDELDTLNRKIIERTIIGNEAETSAPAFKDFQLWLLWKVLCSIETKDRPKIWKNERFEDYQLVVETPYRDFLIQKDNRLFEEMANNAFSWIRDISSERFKFAIWEAWQQANCSYDAPNPACSLGNRYCHRAKLKYPEGRRVMHADMRRFYISLLNEKMWSHDLLMYQLMKLPMDVLSGWKIVNGNARVDGSRVIVESTNVQRLSLLEKAEEGETNREVNVIFGTLKLGIHRLAEVRLNTQDQNAFELRVRGRQQLPENVNVILPDVSFFREDPWFLKRKMAREIYDLEKWGLEKEERASKNSVVQLIDSVFWDKRVLMRRPRERPTGEMD